MMAFAAGDSNGLGHLTTSWDGHDNNIYDNKMTKLLTTLEEIWRHVESKKDEMEIICRENRKLLKPLPHEKSKSEVHEISSEEKGGQMYETTQLEAPLENEIAELNLIDKALEKAQKAWKKHQPCTGDDPSCEVTPESQAKAALGFDSGNLGVTKDAPDDTNVGIISEKELTRALSKNVRVSRMKAAYKKAPFRTSDCERKKITHYSQTDKSQSKSFPQGTSRLKNSKHSQDSKSHSSVKSLQANSNLSKGIKTHSTVTYLEPNNSSGSSQGKMQNNSKIAELEENEKKTVFKLVAGENANKNSEPLYVIPPSIKHLYQQNLSLRRKIAKMETSKSAESFLNLWESKMTKTPNHEAKLLTQKYENLFTLLQSLKLPHLSDSSSPQEILKAKISLEYILTSMYDLNQQTETFLKKAKMKSTAVVTPQMEPVPLIVPKEIWLPPKLLKSPFYHHLKESSLKGLHYSSLEELDEYWDEQYKLQECLFSQHLLKNVFECLLPLLKSQHLQQRERIFLYRILRGFLHHNGRYFPTLIDS